MDEMNNDGLDEPCGSFGLRSELAFAKYVMWPARLALSRHYPEVMRTITAAESVAGFNEMEEYILGEEGVQPVFGPNATEMAYKLILEPLGLEVPKDMAL